MVGISITAAAIILTWLLSSAFSYTFQCDAQDLLYKDLKIGLGIDLSANYGTASLSFPNGSIIAVAKIEGDQIYKDVMLSLSLKSSQHMHPPYTNIGEELSDGPRRALREFSKWLGIPASSDVGSIADMISRLREQAARSIGLPCPTSINSAIVSVMHLPAFYMEDVDDACDFAQLRRTRVRSQPLTPPDYQSHFAFAGYGFGLCRNYTDHDICRAEEANMRSQQVQIITFSRNRILVGFPRLASAYAIHEALEMTTCDFDLPDYDHNSEKQSTTFWDAVYSKIIEVPFRDSLISAPLRLFLMGDSVEDQDFLSTLDRALHDLQNLLDWPWKQEIYNENPVFVAANGAAEMMRRSYYLNPNPILSIPEDL